MFVVVVVRFVVSQKSAPVSQIKRQAAELIKLESNCMCINYVKYKQTFAQILP